MRRGAGFEHGPAGYGRGIEELVHQPGFSHTRLTHDCRYLTRATRGKFEQLTESGHLGISPNETC